MKRAIKLYNILKIHIPDDYMSLEGLDFVIKIMDSIKEKGRYRDYQKALELLLDKPFTEIYDNIKPEAGMETFALGLIENRFADLYSFCSKLGI